MFIKDSHLDKAKIGEQKTKTENTLLEVNNIDEKFKKLKFDVHEAELKYRMCVVPDIKKSANGTFNVKVKCPHCSETLERVKLEKPSNFMLGKKRMSSIEVRERLVNIKDEELRKIGINSRTCRPEWAVISLLLVPSVTVRPSITLDTGERSEDD